MSHHEVSSSHYVKIWGLLLVLLTISVVGPMLEIRAITLITAFGVAMVKAYIVAAEFMHLKLEKKYITYIFVAMLCFVFLFYFGVSPDAGHHEGQNWIKTFQE